MRKKKRQKKTQVKNALTWVSKITPGDDLLSHGLATLSSALNRFTTEFGMDSGGTSSLQSPGNF